MDIQQELQLQQEQELQLHDELQQERQALNLELQQLHRSLIEISRAIRHHRHLDDDLQGEQFEERGEELQAKHDKLVDVIQQTKTTLELLTPQTQNLRG